MPTFINIDGEEPSTVTFTVAAIQLTRNSSAELQEILCIGDPEVASSLGLARVTNTAPASTNAGLNVRILSGPSTVADFSVRAVLPSTYGDHSLRVLQSSAADLNVTVAGYSTTVNVSSLAGAVMVRSSAANHLVTAYQSTATDLLVTAHGNQSSNSSVYLPVRLTNGTSFLTAATDYIHGSTVSTVAANLTGPPLLLRTGTDALSNTNTWTVARGSTAGSLLASLVTDSGASAMDSTNGAVKVNVVAGSATSTTVNVSSLAGAVITRSSAADMLVTASQNSTAWSVLSRQTTSSGGGVEGSTLTPTAATLGLHLREVPSSVQSTSVVVTSSNSTVLLAVLSSQATAQRVHAYFVAVSTNTAPSTVIFMSGSTNHVWGLVTSSGVWGANLAMNPPGEIFRAAAGEALNVVLQNASTAVQARISIGWRNDA